MFRALWVLHVLVPLVALLFAAPARAWVPVNICAGNYQTWESGTFDATISSLSWMDTTYQQGVAEAITSWDDSVIGTSLNVTTSIAPVPMISGDGVNTVAVVDVPGGGAIARVRGSSCTDFRLLHECDIWLHGGQEPDGSPSFTFPYPSMHYDHYDQPWANRQKFLSLKVVHEMGHCLGLFHTAMLVDSATHLAAMNPFYGGSTVIGEREYIGIRKHHVSEDDRVGARTLYPGSPPNTAADVAAQSYFYDESADLQWLCRIWSRPSPANNLVNPSVPVVCLNQVNDPPDPLVLLPGEPFTVQFTLLNLGPWGEPNVDARILLTPENDPTPTTFVIADSWQTGVLNPDLPLEIERNVTVPPTMLNGTYYVVLQLDYNYAIDEDNESNNEAFWNRQIQVVDSPVGCGCGGRGAADPPLVLLPIVVALVWRRR